MQKHPKNHQIGAPHLHRQPIAANHLSRSSPTSLHFQSSHLPTKMSAPNVDDIMNSNPPTIPPLAVTNLHNSGEVPGHPPNLDRTASIKIINLCSELKSYDVHDDGNYVTNVVSGFNTTLLFKKLTRSSDLFDVDIDIDELCKELFRAEEWWANRDLLFNALVAFGEMKGFRVSKKHASIKCNRYVLQKPKEVQ